MMAYTVKDNSAEITEIDGVGVFWRKNAAEHDDAPAEIGGARAEDDALTERILLATTSLRKMAIERMTLALALRDAELSAIRASTRWRITRPLRVLKKLLRTIMPGGK